MVLSKCAWSCLHLYLRSDACETMIHVRKTFMQSLAVALWSCKVKKKVKVGAGPHKIGSKFLSCLPIMSQPVAAHVPSVS